MLRVALRTLVVLSLLLISASAAFAEMDVDGIEELLPHHETAAERARWLGREDQMPGRDRLADPPPPAPLRNCAEWEPTTGVMIRYPLGLPYDLLRDFDDDVILHVVVSNSSYNSAVSALTSQGVDMSKVEWLIKSNDSIWTRDYGPWFVFDGNGDIAIIDHTYNRPWRPNDNLIPIHFGDQQGIPVHSHDMFFTGGNFMTDGAHIGSSTELVYNEAWSENSMNSTQVDQLMFDYYGINNYMVLDYIENGGIHHIDTWMKMLDEQTCLVKDVWASHHTFDELNQRATLLASLPSSNGPNYDVHRVYCYNYSGGNPASYTNSLILNNNIYVPHFGNATYDNDALAAYEAAAPGFNVRGYYYSGFISDDALHCRAKGMMDAGMLRVAHIPLGEQAGPATISAFVHDHSDTGISLVDLHFRYEGGAWQTLAMSAAGGDNYEATLPPPASNGTTDYYIHAEDNSGRSAGMPRVEPARFFSFNHIAGGTGVDTPAAGKSAQLFANYPNPFNPKTVFSFELLYADRAELSVFSASGQHVRTLLDGLAPAGRTEIVWDGRDDFGNALPSGVYLYRLKAAGIQYSRPALLVK